MKRGIDSVYGDSFFYSPLQLKTHLSERTNQADLAKVYERTRNILYRSANVENSGSLNGDQGKANKLRECPSCGKVVLTDKQLYKKCKFCDRSICDRCYRRCVVCSSYSCFLCSILDYGLKEERAFCFDCIKG